MVDEVEESLGHLGWILSNHGLPASGIGAVKSGYELVIFLANHLRAMRKSKKVEFESKTRQESSMIQADSHYRMIMKFVTDGRTEVQTDYLCDNSVPYRPRGSTRQESSTIHLANPETRPAMIFT